MPRARKPKVGRPSLSGKGEAVVVKVKVAPADKKRWESAAAQRGVPLADLVRTAVETEIGGTP